MLVTSIFSISHNASHTITFFDVSGKEAFPTMFSTLLKTEMIFYVTFILSSANAFNLDKVRFLSSGNGLTLSQTTNFRRFQTERVQTTISNSMKTAESSQYG